MAAVVELLLAGLTVHPSRAAAGLRWTRQSVDLTGAVSGDGGAGAAGGTGTRTRTAAGAETAVYEARFPFTNPGPAPVEIRAVSTSCGCTVASLAKRRYEPGEGGEIVARFQPGERTGNQRKEIFVQTDEAAAPVVLTLVVRLPEWVRINPAFVSWQRGEPLVPKIMALTTGPGAPTLSGVRVRPNGTSLTVACRAREAGYEVVVTPQQTERLATVRLELTCRYEDGTERRFQAYALLGVPADPPKPASPAPAAAPR